LLRWTNEEGDAQFFFQLSYGHAPRGLSDI
jgi:hypothetical protein